MQQFQSGDLCFTLQTSSRRKTLGITVDRDGSLLLYTPLPINISTIEAFIDEKRLWIYTKLAEKEYLIEQACAPRQFATGEGFCYLGRAYRLNLIENRIQSLIFKSGRFYLSKNKQGSARELFIDWYRQRGLQRLPCIVAEFTPRLGINANNLRVIDLGNRWGSCNDSGVLNFHWKTMQLPQKLIRYLVAHEVAHLVDKHHSPQFWQTVETLLPNYSECHAELRNDSLKYLRL